MLSHSSLPLCSCGTHAAAWGTGIINSMSLLGRAFRIDPKPCTFPGLLHSFSKAKKLRRRVKHYMICKAKQLLKFILTISGAKYMYLFSGHLLGTKPGFVQSACFCSCQIWFQKMIAVIITESLLCQEHFAACSFGNIPH